jgi:ankyrin repeat protein
MQRIKKLKVNNLYFKIYIYFKMEFLKNYFGIGSKKVVPKKIEPKKFKDIISDLIHAIWDVESKKLEQLDFKLLINKIIDEIDINIQYPDIQYDGKQYHNYTILMFIIMKWSYRDDDNMNYIITELINRGAKLDLQNKDGETALMLVIKKSYGEGFALKNVTLLIEKGANLDLQDKHGDTALMISLSLPRYSKVATLLIENGAELELQNKGGRTALMKATNKNVCELLIDRGAKLDSRDKYGHTALMFSLKYFEVAKLLIDRGADLDLQNEEGLTALMLFVDAKLYYIHYYNSNKTNYIEIIELIVKEKKAKLNLLDKNDETALIKAINNSDSDVCKDVCEILIKGGVELDLQNKDGRTALMEATNINFNKDVCELLINRGAKLDLQDKYGYTALMLSIGIYYNSVYDDTNLNISKLLINKRADLDLKNKDGLTVLMLATKKMENIENSGVNDYRKKYIDNYKYIINLLKYEIAINKIGIVKNKNIPEDIMNKIKSFLDGDKPKSKKRRKSKKSSKRRKSSKRKRN